MEIGECPDSLVCPDTKRVFFRQGSWCELTSEVVLTSTQILCHVHTSVHTGTHKVMDVCQDGSNVKQKPGKSSDLTQSKVVCEIDMSQHYSCTQRGAQLVVLC